MTQFNENKDALDAEFTESRNTRYYGKQKNKKNYHPFATVALSALVSLGCGLGGGYIAVNTFANTQDSNAAKITVSRENSPSNLTNVSSSTGLTTSQVAAIAGPSVVEIKTQITTTSYGLFGGTYTSEAAGSGVIISTDGYIITNAHVIEGADADSITVTTYDGKEYSAALIGSDSKTDIAVIKIEGSNLTAATIGDSSQLEAGDTAIVIGNPLGTLGGTVTDGIISAASREIVINNESMELIQTNAEINSGNSGGGMFDGNGNLIGIVNAKDSGTTSSGTVIEGIGFAIPINTAMDVAEQLIENGKVTNRATLGVYIQELTSDTRHYTAGLYITGIIDGSGAEQAGLQAYDKIVKADGTDISSSTDLSKALRDKKVGDTMTLTIERDGETMQIDVTLTGVLDSTTGSTTNENIG